MSAQRNSGGYPYQDAGLGVPERVADLMGRMSVEEKAGLLFHPIITMNPDGSLVDDPAAAPSQASTRDLVADRSISHFNLLSFRGPGAAGAGATAEWHNALQRLAAEETRWGIPVTLSTDPRHAFTDNAGTSMAAGPFSQWPEPLGLAALRDVEAVREFADIARQEYLAVGFRVALHPQLDLATEPRWARIAQTFGEDADLAARLGVAYLEGLRGGPSVGPDSVAAMAKHFPGGGPQRDGEDPHFPHGKEQVYPGGRFRDHLRPFQAAIAAGVTQIMPGYGVPVGTEYDEVAFGFNDGVINRLLRAELGFDGIVCADWGIINDQRIMGEAHPARAWGVEHLSPAERTLMAAQRGRRPVRRRVPAGADRRAGPVRSAAGRPAGPVGAAAADREVPARAVRPAGATSILSWPSGPPGRPTSGRPGGGRRAPPSPS